MAGFPNFFMIVGPNTGLGHSSMVLMIESQTAYVVDAIKQIQQKGWLAVDVNEEAQAAYNRELQKKGGPSVWKSGCKSWYLGKNGKNTAIWPDFTFRFRKETERFDAGNYRVEPQPRR